MKPFPATLFSRFTFRTYCPGRARLFGPIEYGHVALCHGQGAHAHGSVFTFVGMSMIVLVGNLGADPETFYTPEGNPITNFNLAFKASKNRSFRPVFSYHYFFIF